MIIRYVLRNWRLQWYHILASAYIFSRRSKCTDHLGLIFFPIPLPPSLPLLLLLPLLSVLPLLPLPLLPPFPLHHPREGIYRPSGVSQGPPP